MPSRLSFSPSALADVQEACDWYAARSTNAESRFFAALRARCDVVCRHPEAFGKVHRHYRGALVTGFPYLIVYEIEEDRVVVGAVMHTARGPEAWRERF